jgi:hypothetical protein
MAAKLGIEKTSFTLDVLGRFTCNTDQEAADAMNRPDARPFDVIVVGGGSFGPILAENIFFSRKTSSSMTEPTLGVCWCWMLVQWC